MGGGAINVIDLFAMFTSFKLLHRNKISWIVADRDRAITVKCFMRKKPLFCHLLRYK